MKIIYPATSTRVTVNLVNKVKQAYEIRKLSEPNLRVIDIWHELESKVKVK